MTGTKRNHFNPCFWTAHWNPDYLEKALKGQRGQNRARHQKVFALNIKADKILKTTVENVHYEKQAAVAEITPEAKEFCRRHFPQEYQRFCEEMKSHPETLILDFESILTGLEGTEGYTTLLKIIAKQRVDTALEKAFLAYFVLYHHFRNHAILGSKVELLENAGVPKFDYLLWLRNAWSNTDLMYGLVMTFAPGCWTFYRVCRDTFPLTDSPILIRRENIFVALSPRLLLEIDRTKSAPENSWTSQNFISPDKLKEFRHRTIGNTFREIIFSDRAVLEEWRLTPEFQERHRLLADVKSYNTLVTKHLDRELWKVNAYGNAP